MILHGHTRIGKTAPIIRFCEGKPTLYFPALKDTMQGNLEVLSAAIQAYKDPTSETAPVYPSFQAAFSEIGRLSSMERVIYVIDEYPYLAKADSSMLRGYSI